ncbi:hypothetical protein L1987_00530 [Smallanthus sonchifolius]|uniref:Uncharacterized protein n=1 Tax=Smallanthus sonchifolius TaxID=185202 RepID=A0ACB9K2K9_9ASTR|nr:hypothetical protein L1987_00530 [Smallanthus sonchifolius]
MKPHLWSNTNNLIYKSTNCCGSVQLLESSMRGDEAKKVCPQIQLVHSPLLREQNKRSDATTLLKEKRRDNHSSYVRSTGATVQT